MHYNSLNLHRQGTIKVRVAGDYHCGDASTMVDGLVAARYTINLTVSPNRLEPETGFMVDQEALQRFMGTLAQGRSGTADSLHTASNETGAWTGSCERLVQIWGYALLNWVYDVNPQLVIRELKFTLSPAPHLGAFTATFTD